MSYSLAKETIKKKASYTSLLSYFDDMKSDKFISTINITGLKTFKKTRKTAMSFLAHIIPKFCKFLIFSGRSAVIFFLSEGVVIFSPLFYYINHASTFLGSCHVFFSNYFDYVHHVSTFSEGVVIFSTFLLYQPYSLGKLSCFYQTILAMSIM